MSFSPDWLALRSDADARARNRGVESAMIEALPDRPIHVLDLGSGTGANLDALAPRLGRVQTWTLVDNDADLLDRVVTPDSVVVTRRTGDLAGEMTEMFRPAPDLVTASAFFDLCGMAMIDRIVDATVAAGAVFHTVLTYDGREVWTPPHPLDCAILDAFHADQQRDKGLGPALGPGATQYLTRQFVTAGYKVRTGPSDWVLEAPRDAGLIAALADGSAAAVAGLDGATEWRQARTRAERVVIGHQDLLAVPGDTPG